MVNVRHTAVIVQSDTTPRVRSLLPTWVFLANLLAGVLIAVLIYQSDVYQFTPQDVRRYEDADTYYGQDFNIDAVELDRILALGGVVFGVALILLPHGWNMAVWRALSLVALFTPTLTLLFVFHQRGVMESVPLWVDYGYNAPPYVPVWQIVAFAMLAGVVLVEIGAQIRRWMGLGAALIALLTVGQISGGLFSLGYNGYYYVFDYSTVSVNTMLGHTFSVAWSGMFVGALVAALIRYRRDFRPVHWRLPLLPHRVLPAGNAFIPFEMRHVRRGADEDLLWAQSVTWMIGTFVVVFIFGLAMMALVILDPPFIDPNSYYYDWGMYQTVVDVFLLLLLLSVADRFLLDFIVVMSSVGSISGDMTSGHWDLLKMSDVSSRMIVKAKHAAAQLRGWRVMTLVIGLRAALVVIGFLFVFILPYALPPDSGVDSPWRNVYFSDPREVVAFIFVGLYALALTVIFVLEPRWRVRTLAAGSVLVSSVKRPTAVGMFWGLMCVLTLAAMQALVLLAAFMLIFLFANNITWLLPELFFGFDTLAFWDVLLFGAGLLYLIILIVLAYWAYNHLTWSWIERTVRRLTKQGAAP
ncbi:MAG: hypothetical protein SF029_08845 [bacterium]|nr:hypothetical protein [bacterium]